MDLLQECWLDGSFATFDHIYAQYLFSDTIVLSMSTLLDKVDGTSVDQKGRLETACEVLHELSNSGHLAAVEFHRQVEAIKSATLNLVRRRQISTERVPTLKQMNGGVTEPESDAPTEPTPEQGIPMGAIASEFNLDLQYMDDILSQDISQGLYWPSFD